MKHKMIELTEIQKDVARRNSLEQTGLAFEAFARGDEKAAGMHARQAFRYARRIVDGVKI